VRANELEKRDADPNLGRTDYAPPELTEIGVDEKAGSMLPLDAAFVDESGRPVTLGSYFGKGRPVVLQMSYFSCPRLCSLVSQGLVESLKESKLDIGKDFDVVNVSFDPTEKSILAASKKRSFLSVYDRPGAAASWHFLTGEKDSIKRITDATGFKYRWVETAGQFSHPAVLIVASADGKITRYLYGIRFDVKIFDESIADASKGKISSPLAQLILTCFMGYDSATGQYSGLAMGLMRTGGALTVLVLMVVLGLQYLKDSRQRRRDAAEDPLAHGAAGSVATKP
jgi:protein SCO1/2